MNATTVPLEGTFFFTDVDTEIALKDSRDPLGFQPIWSNDSRSLAHLLRHGMIRPGFVPDCAVRDLRDLTRRRKQLVGEGSRERNRIQKILEDANIKLGDVLSDVLGLSGKITTERHGDELVIATTFPQHRFFRLPCPLSGETNFDLEYTSKLPPMPESLPTSRWKSFIRKAGIRISGVAIFALVACRFFDRPAEFQVSLRRK